MKTKAAICWEVGSDWSVEEIDLDPPKSGEVLIKVAASGMCHSDEHLRKGDMHMPAEMGPMMGHEQFPIIGGHEGAGVIEEVGPDVKDLEVGDHVLLSFIPSCGRCESCMTGKSHICDLGMYLLAGRQISDHTARHHARGRDVGIMTVLGTFSPYTVVNEASCIKIEKDIPLDKAALIGCGVTTGFGSAVYAAEVMAGDTVVVIGAGGIGMNAIQGAALSGARQVIAVDPVEFKREQAMNFGATHTLSSIEEALGALPDLTWGKNADKVIVTTGDGDGSQLGMIMMLVAKGGRCVYTALANMFAFDAQLNLFDLAMQRKELRGTIFGNANPRADVPRLLHLYRDGKYKLDELITQRYELEDVNQGYTDMLAGKNIRGVIDFD